MSAALITRLPVTFKEMAATQIEWRDGVDGGQAGKFRLKNEGPTLGGGNYKLVYTDSAGSPVDLTAAGYRLTLLVDKRGLIDVTGVQSGSALGGKRLLQFLRVLDRLEPVKWGQKIQCQLIVQDTQGIEVAGRSHPVQVSTPVKPWVGSLDPELFAADKTITYCLADETVGYAGEAEKYYGQFLRRIPGDHNPNRRYFTFKKTLQTDPKYRGFDCICFVGNLYGIEPGPAYDKGAAMAVALKGEPAVQMNREQVIDFLKTDEGRAGWYIMYTGGHVGLIRSGVLFECKPSGRGFTPGDTYITGEASAVRRFVVGDLESSKRGLRDQTYWVSRVPPPGEVPEN